LDILPDYDWNLVKAGLAAGYSDSYARTQLPGLVRKDRRFASLVLERKQSSDIQTLDLRQEAVRTLRDIIADPETSQRDRISAVSELGRINGWHTETRILETGPRAEQLRQAEITVARRAALACYDTHLLADGSYAPAAPAMQHGTVIVASNADDDDDDDVATTTAAATAAAADASVTSDMDADDVVDDADADNDDMQ